MKLLRILGIALLGVAAVSSAAAQSWQRVNNNPPVNIGTILLLTDVTVIGHQEDDQTGDVATLAWYKLTPDINGSYVNGTWTQIASLPSGYGPLFFGSAVLKDGRVLVEGGEYNQYGSGFSKLGAIYDPVANTWTSVNPPSKASQRSIRPRQFSWETPLEEATVARHDGGQRSIRSFPDDPLPGLGFNTNS